MTPGARAAAAIEVLTLWQSGEEAMDRVLATWGRSNRYAGSGDRRAVADLVYGALRRCRSAGLVAGSTDAPTPREVVIGALRLDGVDPAGLFTGLGHAPDPLTGTEVAGADLADAPDAVRLDIPDWLWPDLAALGEAALAPTRNRAPLFLRVNPLRATPAAAIAFLADEGILAEPGPLAPHCLRVIAGNRQVEGCRTLAEGLIEIQDAASQAAALFAGAEPGMRVLDHCAGGGGKTLALGAAMGGRGELFAHDIAPKRLAQLDPRAQRAGLSVTCLDPGQTEGLAKSCDLVFVDAPCSGSGAWARNPDAKWRLTPERLAALMATQDAVLAEAARAVRPGGRLVYATCSLLAAENQDRIAAFLAHAPDFEPEGSPRLWTPAEGGDGFFAARLRRLDTATAARVRN